MAIPTTTTTSTATSTTNSNTIVDIAVANSFFYSGGSRDCRWIGVLGQPVYSQLVNTAMVPTLLAGANVTVTSDPVMINDANVTAADINTTNGVFHVINRVLIPPTLTTADNAGEGSNVVSSQEQPPAPAPAPQSEPFLGANGAELTNVVVTPAGQDPASPAVSPVFGAEDEDEESNDKKAIRIKARARTKTAKNQTKVGPLQEESLKVLKVNMSHLPMPITVLQVLLLYMILKKENSSVTEEMVTIVVEPSFNTDIFQKEG